MLRVLSDDPYLRVLSRPPSPDAVAAIDPDTTLASWAREADFPMLFASDSTGTARRVHGAFDAERRVDDRSPHVIGPEACVEYRISPFRQLAPAEYWELADVIDRLPPAPADAH